MYLANLSTEISRNSGKFANILYEQKIVHDACTFENIDRDLTKSLHVDKLQLFIQVSEVSSQKILHSSSLTTYYCDQIDFTNYSLNINYDSKQNYHNSTTCQSYFIEKQPIPLVCICNPDPDPLTKIQDEILIEIDNLLKNKKDSISTNTTKHLRLPSSFSLHSSDSSCHSSKGCIIF